MQAKRKKNRKAFASSMMVLLLLAALIFKAFFPAGFMPVVSEKGMIEIVICSGMDQKTVFIPADEAPDTGHTDAPSDKVCGYQILAFGKFFIAPLIATIDAPPAPHITALNIHDQLSANNLFAISFDARGPPRA